MQKPVKDSDLEHLSLDYDPEKMRQTKHQWITWLVVVVLVAFISVGATLGITKLQLPFTLLPTTGISSNADTDTWNINITIADTAGQKALLLVEGLDGYSEIKVADTTSNTVMIQDLTRGQFLALSAALAPNQIMLAYIRDEKDNRVVEVITITNGSSTVISPSELRDKNDNAYLKPCDWSPIAWSPDSQQFAFFGCYRNLSNLIVIDVANAFSTTVYSTTKSIESPPRQIIWINAEALFYTHYDTGKGVMSVQRLETSVSAPDPFLIYER